jgi:hypothetical protein
MWHMSIPPADQLSLRPTVIAGEKGKDDYLVIWNGISIGRIPEVTAVGGRDAWNWGVSFPHQPQLPAHRGQESDLEECKRFKVVWGAIHRELTETDVGAAISDQEAIKDRPWNRRQP